MAETKTVLRKRIKMPQVVREEDMEPSSTNIELEEISVTPNLDPEGVDSVANAFGKKPSRPEQYESFVEKVKKGLIDMWGRPLSESATETTQAIQDRNKPKRGKK